MSLEKLYVHLLYSLIIQTTKITCQINDFLDIIHRPKFYLKKIFGD
jgi:hypothetical protein